MFSSKQSPSNFLKSNLFMKLERLGQHSADEQPCLINSLPETLKNNLEPQTKAGSKADKLKLQV